MKKKGRKSNNPGKKSQVCSKGRGKRSHGARGEDMGMGLGRWVDAAFNYVVMNPGGQG